jgi:excisionase family DNA binding protein
MLDKVKKHYIMLTIMNDIFYTIDELAVLLKVHRATITRWIESGKLTAYKPAGQYRISKEQLEKFLNNKNE